MMLAWFKVHILTLFVLLLGMHIYMLLGILLDMLLELELLVLLQKKLVNYQ